MKASFDFFIHLWYFVLYEKWSIQTTRVRIQFCHFAGRFYLFEHLRKFTFPSTSIFSSKSSLYQLKMRRKKNSFYLAKWIRSFELWPCRARENECDVCFIGFCESQIYLANSHFTRNWYHLVRANFNAGQKRETRILLK